MNNQDKGHVIVPPKWSSEENEGLCRAHVKGGQISAADKRSDNSMDPKRYQNGNSGRGIAGISYKGLDLKGLFEPSGSPPFVSKGNNTASLESNDDRKRAHKESVTTRHSAGGSNKGAMKPEKQPLVLPDDTVEELPKVLEKQLATIKHSAEEDLVNREWGVYTSEPHATDDENWTPYYEKVILGSIAGFLIAYIICDKVDYATIIVALASATIVALTAKVPRFNRGPSLEGAGSNVDVRCASMTSKGHIDSLAFTAWQEGHVYNAMSVQLISQFVGCKIDEHVVRRAMKRANELQSLYNTPLDRGVMADTVSYSMCVVNVEMARAGSSIRPTKIIPWSGAWS